MYRGVHRLACANLGAMWMAFAPPSPVAVASTLVQAAVAARFYGTVSGRGEAGVGLGEKGDASSLLPPPPLPRSIGGGPFHDLLQRVIEDRLAVLHREQLAALDYLLHVAEGADAAVSTATLDHVETRQAAAVARELRMWNAIRTLRHHTHCPTFCDTNPAHLVVSVGHPAGHVRVPLVVGEVYFLLQRLGADAAGWWGRYYAAFIAPQAAVPEDGEAHGGTTPTADAASGATPPPFCWLFHRRWSVTGGGSAATAPRPALFAVLLPWHVDSPPTRCVRATGEADAAQVRRSSVWIQNALIAHLPFLPIPPPRGCLRGPSPRNRAADRVVADARAEASLWSLTTSTGQSVCDGMGHNVAEPAFSTMPWTNEAGGMVEATSTTTTGTTASWSHSFYDNLFLDVADRGSPTLCGDAASSQTWRPRVATRGNLVPSRVAMVSRTNAPCITAIPPPPPPPPFSPGAAAASAAAWPAPTVSWLFLGSQWRGLSTFWSQKSNLCKSLPSDYFFPMEIYMLLRQRVREELRRNVFNIRRAGPRRGFVDCIQGLRSGLQRRTPCSSGVEPQSSVTQALRELREDDDWLPHSTAAAAAAASEERPGAAFTALCSSSATMRVVYFGKRYVSVDATALSCLVDSNTCTRHAVPLSVTGEVLFWGMHQIRCRQHVANGRGGRRGVPQAAEDDSGDDAASLMDGSECRPPRYYSTAMAKVAEAEARLLAEAGGADETGSASADAEPAPWLVRMRQIQNDDSVADAPLSLPSRFNRVLHMAVVLRSTHFTFRSPYWVEVRDIYERWGVRVAPRAMPLMMGGTAMVNAEQTTDASRFTPSTCVPHLAQQVLTTQGVFPIVWEASQQLLAQVAPDTVPRRRPGGVCAWTYATLCGRAAAAQRVSNLWITDAVVAMFGWTLQPSLSPPTSDETNEPAAARPGIQCARVQLREVWFPRRLDTQYRSDFIDVVHVLEPHGDGHQPFSPRHLQALPPSPGHATGSAGLRLSESLSQWYIPLVHSSCVAEQAELRYVAAYDPLFLVSRVPELSSGDTGYEAYVNAVNMLYERGGCPRDTDGGDGSRIASRGDGCDGDCAVEGAEQDAGPVSKERLKILHHTALVAKLRRFHSKWDGGQLTLPSRLELARLSLERRYSKEHASRWVSVDFLRDEPRIRPVTARAGVEDAGEGSGTGAPCTTPTPSAAGTPRDLSPSVKAINVEVVFRSEGDTDEHLHHQRGEGARQRRVVTLTVINEEELEWPAGVVASSQHMWLWKKL